MLLLADEQENMIDKYLENGEMFVLRVKNFFTDNYDHPIFEDGIHLVDMVYLKRDR